MGQRLRIDRFEALCLASIAIGIALRFYRLGQPLWLDEAQAVGVASFGKGLEIVRSLVQYGQITPPLFFLLLRGWMRWFGDTDVALHLLAAIVGSTAVLATGWVGVRTAGRTQGLIAGALLALHPLHIAYSQEVRAYGLATLLSALCYYGLWRAMRTDEWQDWAAFAAVSLIFLYTHHYAIFLLTGLAVWAAAVAIDDHRRPSGRNLLLFGAIVAVGYAPWLSRTLHDVRLVNGGYTDYLAALGLVSAGKTLLALCGLLLAVNGAEVPWSANVLRVLWIPIVAAMLYVGARARNRRDPMKLALVPLTTLAIPYLVSLHAPIYAWNRYPVIVLPFVCLLFAAALAKRPMAIRSLALVLTLGLFAPTTYAYFSRPKSFNRAIGQFIDSRSGPGSRLLVYPPWFAVSILRYSRLTGVSNQELLGAPAERLPAGIVSVHISHPVRPDIAEEVLDPAIRRGYKEVASQLFGGFAVVRVYEKKANAP